MVAVQCYVAVVVGHRQGHRVRTYIVAIEVVLLNVMMRSTVVVKTVVNLSSRDGGRTVASS